MKTRFPKLQNFLIKDEKKKSKTEKTGDEPINFTNAYVYKGHIIASDSRVMLFFNLKEYLKQNFVPDEDEDITDGYELINSLCEDLEGSLLSKEFFTVFSKIQTIKEVGEFSISVESNGFHSEYSIGEGYNTELLEKFLKGQKNIWNKVRSEQGQFCVSGAVISSILKVLGSEITADSLIFERTEDGRARFCLENKDYIFGLCLFSVSAEQSITKFGEASEFFDVI